MHRELSHADDAFAEESNQPLYLMTALLAALLAADLLPLLSDWLGLGIFTWKTELWGYAYVATRIAAILGGVRVIYLSLFRLFEGKIGADLAIAIAFLAALAIQEWFVAAEVVFIGMFGECLEGFTFDRTKSAIRKLVEVFPIRCWVLKDGQETRVFTKDLQVGDCVVVKPGAKIPADGIVLAGRSSVDTSALTGESLPLDKGPGDEVLAGSVNMFGALTIDARRVARQTVAGRVIELTAQALKDKSNIERTADRLARFFLPIVLAVAAVTFLACLAYYSTGMFRPANAPRIGIRQALTFSVYPTLSVLVVACPCALILATPAAVIAALGRLAGTGVLIKSGAALERLANVRAVAFDKTGTITEAKLELGDVICLTGLSADELLGIAAAAEQRSEHPLARLLVQEAARRQLKLDAVLDFHAHPGAGVTAHTAGGAILIGTRRLLEEKGIPISDAATAALAHLDATGQTALLVACDGVVLGVLGARDRLRPDAQPLLKELRELGIDPIVLLTGDRAAAAEAVAEGLSFDDIHAELLPDQKAKFIDEWKARKLAVAMVGDGINDAPALARADVGIAIGSGADIAAEAGDIIFMGDPLKQLPLLIRLSRETAKIIRQNIIVFAFVVNAVGVLLTSWLWPLITPASWYEQSPLASVIYHQLGSFLVLLNSMRLLWFARGEDRYQKFEDWLAKNLDIAEIMHSCEHHWRRLALGSSVLAGLAFVFSGFTIIGPDEVGVVLRFGRPIEGDLSPGWYLRYPWPVEETLRVSQQVRTVSIGFRESADKTGALTWSSGHRKETRNPREAMMMTGDGNLVDLFVTVRFKVTEPRVYLFQVANAEEIIRAATESELRTMVAGRAFQSLLTTQRGRFQNDVLERVKSRCRQMASDGLGVELDGMSIIDLHPPPEVVESYYDVAKAMERRDQLINEAAESKIRKIKKAEADVKKLLAQARAAGVEKYQEATADYLRFRGQHRPRVELSLAQELELAFQADTEVLLGEPAEAVAAKYRDKRAKLLAQQPALVDFRLYWESVSKSLAGRELLLIDSDKVMGRRNLLLFDPDQFRVPFPVFMPQERPPPAPFRPKEEH